MQHIKLVIVGDGGVGKSCLLITYTTHGFPSEYVPTVFDNYSCNIIVDSKPVNIAFWDTAGQEDYDRLRPLSYPGTDIFLLAFSIDNPASLRNIEEKWYPETTHHCPSVPKLLVGCKGDLRERAEAHTKRHVTYKDAKAVAGKLGMQYLETSSLVHTGLTELFNYAVSAAVSDVAAKRSRSFVSRLSGRRQASIPLPPIMPPAGKAPWLEVATSTCADDWYKLLQDPHFHDVTFVVEGGRQLQAHRVLLSSASRFFAKLLGVSAGIQSAQQREMSAIEAFDRQEINSGLVPGIARVHDSDTKPGADICGAAVRKTTITLSQDIKASTFLRVLEFLYTGVPRLPEDVSQDEVAEVERVAGLFKLTHLQTICHNIRTDQEFLNPSIGTFVTDMTGAEMKRVFLNQPDYADLVFKVQGSRLYAHRAVVAARSPVMAAMFLGHFREGTGQSIVEITVADTSVDDFLALLEYLYTDHAPIEERDALEILMLSDEYLVPRLGNLCELYISKDVERNCSRNIHKCNIDIIGVLQTAQTYNALQLAEWCLHFISTNYLAFEKRPEFGHLSSDNRKYIEEHRWPPLSYLMEVEEYEKALGKGEKCLLM